MMKSGFKRTTAAILAALILASAGTSIAVFSGVGTSVAYAEETGSNTQSETSVVSLKYGTATTYYDTLQEAANAIPSEKGPGKYILTLLKDTSEDVTFSANRHLYLQLNGCTLDGTIQRNLTESSYQLYINQDDSTGGGCVTGNISSQGMMNIYGGHFQGAITCDRTLRIYGGSFVNDYSDNVTSGNVLEKTETVDEHGCQYQVVKDQVASIERDGETIIYETLSKAISAAQDGETVTVMKDITGNVAFLINKSITVDLNGHTVTGSSQSHVFQVGKSSGIDVTIKNGSIIHIPTGSNANGAVYARYKGNLTLDNVKINGKDYGVRIGSGNDSTNPTVTITGTETTISGAVAGIAVLGKIGAESAELIVEDGTISGGYYGIAGNGSNDNTKITISGGTIKTTNESDSTAIYHPQAGDLTISGGTIEGVNGVQFCGEGNLEISGGKIIATAEATEFPQKTNTEGDGSTVDGAALSIVSRGSGYQSAENKDNAIKVNITGGELISNHNAAISVYRMQNFGTNSGWQTSNIAGNPITIDNYLASLNISGGTLTGSEEKGAIEFISPDQNNPDVETKEKITASGGTYSSDVTEYVAQDKAAIGITASGETTYYVGTQEDVQRAVDNVSDITEVTVVKVPESGTASGSDPTFELTGLPVGTKVNNNTNTTITVNNQEVASGVQHEVPGGGGGTIVTPPVEPEKPAVAQVQNLKAVKKATTWLKLNFDQVEGADGYEIYNVETNEKLADCTTQNGRAVLTKTVTGLNKGTTYKLQVRAYKLVDGERVYGDFSKVYTKATAYLDKVTGVRPIKKTQTTLKIQFNKVEGAERYKIFDAETGKMLCTVSTQSGADVLKKTITGLKAGERRQYKVRAYATINGKNEYGEFSKTLVKATAD